MKSAELVAHHLRLFGLARAGTEPHCTLLVLDGAEAGAWSRAMDAVSQGRSVVFLSVAASDGAAARMHFDAGAAEAWTELLVHRGNGRMPLRTLHEFSTMEGDGLRPVVVDNRARAAWAALTFPKATLLLVGTDLAADLVRFRQGDPAAAARRPTEALWGIEGERPNYLFEEQLTDAEHDARFADWWCEALAVALVRHGGVHREPILPGGAPGAIVVTGDDDQASIADYLRQRELLGNLPVTYFLHPLTHHNVSTLEALSATATVEWELHPDALAAPGDYDRLFEAQVDWFGGLMGRPPRLVRNHGFLNNGYWGHLATWLRHGIKGSSNLPGLDGRVLNGSLLPARMVLDGELSYHWSILTAIGDGVVFALSDDEAKAAGRICQLGERIVGSGVPGVIVVNLHPANVSRTGAMHQALHDLVAAGFVAWNLGQCLEWFEVRDRGEISHRSLGGVEPQGALAGKRVPTIRKSYRQRIAALVRWAKGGIIAAGK